MRRDRGPSEFRRSPEETAVIRKFVDALREFLGKPPLYRVDAQVPLWRQWSEVAGMSLDGGRTVPRRGSAS